MPLIKDGAIAKDEWVLIEGVETSLPEEGAAIVSLEYWREYREALLKRNAPLGIKLKSDQSPALIKDDLDRFQIVAIDFPAFTDGRGFSYARLLRERFGYQGEVRATGHFIRDQFHFLNRCGFDALEVKDESLLDGWKAANEEFDVWYQWTGDGRKTAMEKRTA